jgi:secretion/DNA translocation related CpaE-like protein
VNSERDSVVLASGDPDIIQMVHASAATRGSPVRTVADPKDVRARWREAGAVLVGADLADTLLGWGLPPRDEVYLVGTASTHEALCRASMPLRGVVVTLPDGARSLAQILSGAASERTSGQVVAVAGGAGGLGASTLAAGLALAARRRGPAALVDVDHGGGGIDLLLGAEAVPGWRWDTLRSAAGQVADLDGHLPLVDGVAIVSMSRTDRRAVPAEAIGAVVDGLAGAGGLVVIDVGRTGGAAQLEAVRAASRIIVLTGQTVRAVAATAATADSFADRRCDVVVRLDRSGAITPALAAESLGWPLLGTIPSSLALVTMGDRGVPPGTGGARPWARARRRIVATLLSEAAPTQRGRWRP